MRTVKKSWKLMVRKYLPHAKWTQAHTQKEVYSEMTTK